MLCILHIWHFLCFFKAGEGEDLPACLKDAHETTREKNMFARRVVTLTSAVTLFAPLSASADFIGPYDVANWTTTLNGEPPAGGSTIDTSDAPASITFLGGDSGCITDFGVFECTIDFTIAAAGSGNVSFDWNYQTFDVDGPGFELWGFLDGVFTQLSDSSGPNVQSGSETFLLAAGNIFGFRLNCTDCILGPANITVSKLQRA
jgi:hypothetical protein